MKRVELLVLSLSDSDNPMRLCGCIQRPVSNVMALDHQPEKITIMKLGVK